MKHSHYYKDVRKLETVDVYAVCKLFNVQDPSGALQHAIKKLLVAGGRGAGKTRTKDLSEAVDTLTRLIELENTMPVTDNAGEQNGSTEERHTSQAP